MPAQPTFKRDHAVLALLLLLLLSLRIVRAQSPSGNVIVLDASAPVHNFPHFWERMFGSGRAILSLRESYRRDLREVKEITDFQYVRFHAIFHDEVGLYNEDERGRPVYNFSYVDQIYDGLLKNHVRPFVELSFMPKKLASADIVQAFWYKPIVAPPRDWSKWDDMIATFAHHLIDRYGSDEVSQWYFEVWNEPNLDFWGGNPRQATYWELYDHTARALKSVSPRIRVGGPATAQAAWADAFIKHCHDANVPLDFVSTHVYGNDRAQDVFGTDETIPRDRMVCRAVRKVHDQIESSSEPGLPLIWSEFNASYANEPAVTDTSYMGPWLADTIRQCDGLVDMMSYWTFSDVFEEQGVVKTPFYGGFGLVAEDGIPKPAFNAFKLLHQLGDQRIEVSSDAALLTRNGDGSIVAAVWNYAGPDEAGTPKTWTLRFEHVNSTHALVSIADPRHGDSEMAFKAMGAPRFPTEAQIRQLRQAAILPPAYQLSITSGSLTLTLAPHALAVIEVK